MPRSGVDRYAVGNSFLNSFMQGYSFVDNIYARKRDEKRLEEELAIRRERQKRMDDLVFEQRQFLKEDRARAADYRERGRAAAAIMATENPDLDILGKDYADIPGVLDFVKKEQERRGIQSDLETGFQGDPSFQQRVQGAAGGVAAGQPDPNAPLTAENPGTMTVRGGDQTMGVDPAAPLPNAMQRPGVAEFITKDMTADQINQAVRERTMTEEEAKIQRALRANDEFAQSTDAHERAMQARIRDARDKRIGAAKSEISEANRIAESFVDTQDGDGDVYRNWSPTQATQWYHRNRANISDPTVRQNMDKMMESRIAASLDASRAIMLDDNISTDSNEFRNAQRQFSQGLGLAQSIATVRSPTDLAGDDGRGVSRRNTAMIDSTIAAAGQGRPAPLPGNPNQHRVQMAIANKGNQEVRVGKKYADAAYGLMSRGIIDIKIYSQMIKTGAPLGDILAAQGISQKFVQGDPSKDLWLETVNPDGSVTRTLAVPARTVPKVGDLEEQYRNTFGGDAIKHLYNNIAATYNTDDDPDRGKRTVNSFLADMAANEATARANGYSYKNVNDVALLYQRWADLHVVKDVYDRELSGGWFDKPTFSDQYGSIDQRIFDRSLDQELQSVIAEEGLETAGGNDLRLTGLKPIGGAEVAWLRQQFPNETAQMSDQEIREIVLDQQRQLGR